MRILHKSEINLTENIYGGKVKGLLLLDSYDLNVPEFFIINSVQLNKIKNNEIDLNAIISDWQLTYNIADNDLWAVRSSAGNEDGENKSYAGQYETVLNVNINGLLDAILKVADSFYKQNKYSEITIDNTIIIQKMIPADFSGVLFTKTPVFPYKNDSVIQIIEGLGDKLVSGELEGEKIIVTEQKEISFDSNNEVLKKIDIDLIETLIDESLRIENKLQSALDFEFSIYNKKIYWLQMRPITTRKLHEKFIVWDNTSVEANFPELTLPLSVTFITKTYGKAYSALGGYLGFSKTILAQNYHYLSSMSGAIYGRLFYNLTAWQSMVSLLPFGSKLSLNLPSIWGMAPVNFKPTNIGHSKFKKGIILMKFILSFFKLKKLKKNYINNHKELLRKNDSTFFKTKTIDELRRLYEKIEKDTSLKWTAPVLNGVIAMIFHMLLKKSLKNTNILKQYPNFQNDILYTNNEVISIKIIREHESILNDIYNQNDAKAIFLSNDNAIILREIKEKHPLIHTKITDYIKLYGDRIEGGELKLETVTYKQNPELFINSVKSSLKHYQPRKSHLKSFNYLKIIKQAYKINLFKRIYLKFLINQYVKRVKDRENYKFMRVETFGVIRSLFIEMGLKMSKNNYFNKPNDIFYLSLKDVLSQTEKDNYKRIIEKRKKQYSTYKSQTITNRYYEVNNKLYPEFSDLIDTDNLVGIGCCSGCVEGKVKIIDENTDFNGNFKDYILVSAYFDPGWVNIFYQAKGVISERGNLLSHTAIICRELNLPSIVGVKGAINSLKNGNTIVMDGALGTIKIKDD